MGHTSAMSDERCCESYPVVKGTFLEWTVPCQRQRAYSDGDVLDLLSDAKHRDRQADTSDVTTDVGSCDGESSCERSSSFCSWDDVDPTHTTVMLYELGNNITRKQLLQRLNAVGLRGLYDFVYLPMDYKFGLSFGHAVVNFVSHQDAVVALRCINGVGDWATEEPIRANWSTELQGLQAHVDRFRNSPAMHHSVSDEFKPIILCNGEIVSFPAPTKKIKAPARQFRVTARLRKAMGSSDDDRFPKFNREVQVS